METASLAEKNIQLWIFNPDGELLLINEKKSPTMQWKIPAGKIIPGESVEKAVRRELYETFSITDYQIVTRLSAAPQNENVQAETTLGATAHVLIFVFNPLQIELNEEEAAGYDWETPEQYVQRAETNAQQYSTQTARNAFFPLIKKWTE